MYRVRAFIDTPRFAKDYKIEKPFSMKNTVNLNEIPGVQVNVLHRPPYSKKQKSTNWNIFNSDIFYWYLCCHLLPIIYMNMLLINCFAQEPSSSSVTKNFSYMLVKNGTVLLKAKSDMRGYIAGQIIKVFAEIENKSEKSTGHVVASLIQVRWHQLLYIYTNYIRLYFKNTFSTSLNNWV